LISGSSLPGFYRLSLAERVATIARLCQLDGDDLATLRQSLTLAAGERMTENVIGLHALPLGIAVNFLINRRDFVVPMVIEEPSVVAACSYAAKLVRQAGGFFAEATDPVMIGQIQVLDVPAPDKATRNVLAARDDLLALVNTLHPTIVQLGGGARELEVRPLPHTPAGPMLIVHLLLDVRDAQGANAVNTACEAIAPRIAELTGGRVNLRILSNLTDRRLVRVHCRVPADSLAAGGSSGPDAVRGIVEAYALAAVDPYRAATHNKGIMNGVDAVALATGNDWRALEAGAHAYAARTGHYTSLTRYELDANGNLRAELEMPMAVATVGGTTAAHPTARLSLKILGVQNARELAEVMGAVGLAQNLAALRALAAEGIQRGHMALHARQIALAAGATGDDVERVAAQLVAERQIRLERARQILSADREYPT
jgi:hydroxymethylglutaryl-CoA reductase